MPLFKQITLTLLLDLQSLTVLEDFILDEGAHVMLTANIL